MEKNILSKKEIKKCIVHPNGFIVKMHNYHVDVTEKEDGYNIYTKRLLKNSVDSGCSGSYVLKKKLMVNHIRLSHETVKMLNFGFMEYWKSKLKNK